MRADPLAQGPTAVTTTKGTVRPDDQRLARESGNWIIVDADATTLVGGVEEAHSWGRLPTDAMTLHMSSNRWNPGSIELIGTGSIVGIANASLRFITVDRTPSAKVMNLVPSLAVFAPLEPLSHLARGTARVIALDDIARLYQAGDEIILPPGFSLLTSHTGPAVPERVSRALAADFSSITERLGTLEVMLPALSGVSSDAAATIGRSLRAIESSLAQLQSPAISAVASDIAASISSSLKAIERSLSQLMSPAGMAPAVLPGPSPSSPSPSGNRAVQAVEDLQQWLDLTLDQVAELTGTSTSAIHYWKRENALPRPGTARHLFKVHALVRALKAATEPDPPLSTLTATPVHGGPSAYKHLISGNYDQAETLLRNLLFSAGRLPSDQRSPDLAGDSIPPPEATGLGLKPPVKRARRVKLTGK